MRDRRRRGHIAAAHRPAARATSGAACGRQAGARADHGELDRLGAADDRSSIGAVAGAPDAAQIIAVARLAAPKRRRKPPLPAARSARVGGRDQGDALGAVGREAQAKPAPARDRLLRDQRRPSARRPARPAPARPSGGGSCRAFRCAPSRASKGTGAPSLLTAKRPLRARLVPDIFDGEELLPVGAVGRA